MLKTINETFASEVLEGLTSEPKHLSSKWFYDERGDELFIQIMKLPEYYLTRAEEEVFRDQTNELAKALTENHQEFDLFELGAGDGSKTFHLLKSLDKNQYRYRPIDISENAVENLKSTVSIQFPNVQCNPIQGEYFSSLDSMKEDRAKVILFMGSNIGNMLDDRANQFMRALSAKMKSGDTLLLGVDLKKSKDIVLPAYNDSQGVTSAFNLNLLHRINEELGADFNVEAFKHTPEYDEESGGARSYLTSLRDQSVFLEFADQTIHFQEGECIFTEVSRKYDDASLRAIMEGTGLRLTHQFFDSNRYFCDAVFVKD